MEKQIFRIFLCENRNLWYLRPVVDLSARQDQVQRRGKGDKKNFFCPRGRHNLLKRLDSAKEIQGNPSPFLCLILLGLGWILLDLAKFGFGLEYIRCNTEEV